MYSFESKVRYSECDELGNLTLLSLIDYLQDSSTFHSEELGRGVKYMSDRGIAWLIAAWQIEIDRLPRFCDYIKVNTWSYSMKRTLAGRNFTICDDQGEAIVRADSLWFVYDFKAERPVRITPDQHVFLSDETPLDMPPTKRKLPVEGPFSDAPAITVSELHLDSNRHVNNAQYLGMAINAITELYGPEVAGRTTDIARINIAYTRQALLGDIIVPRVQAGQEVCTVVLTDPEDNTYSTVQLELRA